MRWGLSFASIGRVAIFSGVYYCTIFTKKKLGVWFKAMEFSITKNILFFMYVWIFVCDALRKLNVFELV